MQRAKKNRLYARNIKHQAFPFISHESWEHRNGFMKIEQALCRNMPIIASFGCQIYSNCLSRCNWILRVQPDWPIYASLIILYIHMDFQTYRRFFIFCTELQIAILNICPSHTYIYIYINESCFVKWPIKIDKYVFFDCIVTERAKTIRQIRNSWPFYWLQLMGEDGDGRIVIHVRFVNWKPLNVSILLIAYTIFFFLFG